MRTVFLRLAPVLLFCASLSAQTPSADPSNSNSTTAARTAPVTVDGDLLFNLPGISAFPAEERAARVSQAILDLAQDPNFQPGSLRIVPQETYRQIMAGDRVILNVTDLDSTREQVAIEVLSQFIVRRIDESVRAYRESRRPEALFKDTIYALLTLVGYYLALIVLRRIARTSVTRLELYYRTKLSQAPEKARALVEGDNLWHAINQTIQLVWSAVMVAGGLFALNLVLSLFPWTRSFARHTLQLVIDPVRSMGVEIANFIPELVFLTFVFYLTRLLIKVAQMFFGTIARGTVELPGFPPEWAMPTYRLVRLLIVALALVVAYPYFPGSGSEAFKGVSILVGVLFSIGSSSLTSNIVAGYSLTYRRAFRVGDIIQIGDVIGRVTSIRLQVTHVVTPKNEEVIVPNVEILNRNVINYSSLAQGNRLILHTTVGIGYEVPWRQVEAMLLTAAGRTKELLTTPPPFVLQRALDDFAVKYELNVYCDQPHRQLVLYSELHKNILDVFNEHGVQIMTPAYEGDPDQPKVVSREQWFASPATAPGSANSSSLSNPPSAAGQAPVEDGVK